MQRILHTLITKNILTTRGRKLEKILREFNDTFEGKVGNYKDLKINFELKPNARPFFGMPLNIPVSLLPLCKAAI